MPDPQTLGYIAGIIDGEASILLSEPRRKDKRSKLHISIGCTSLSLLEFMEQHMGGKARLWLGVCQDDCSENHVHARKQRYYWRITGERAWIVLHTIAPLLLCRAEDTQRILAQYTPTSRFNAGTVLRIAEDMADKGWDIDCVH